MEALSSKAKDYTDEQIDIICDILQTPMTPYDFRLALQKHKFLNYVGAMYDALLVGKLQRKRMRPIVAEQIVMKEVRIWWLKEMTRQDKNRLERKYAGIATDFFINLTRHLPAILSNSHWEQLERGVAPRLYKPILLKYLKPDVVSYIDKRIQELGDDNIFHIKILKTTEDQFSVGVQVITEAELSRLQKKRS